MVASIVTSSTGPLNPGSPVPHAPAATVTLTSGNPVLMTWDHRAAAVVNAACCDALKVPLKWTSMANASGEGAPTFSDTDVSAEVGPPSDTRSRTSLMPAVLKVADRIDALVHDEMVTSKLPLLSRSSPQVSGEFSGSETTHSNAVVSGAAPEVRLAEKDVITGGPPTPVVVVVVPVPPPAVGVHAAASSNPATEITTLEIELIRFDLGS